MALDLNPSGAQVAAFLRRNDSKHCHLKGYWVNNIFEWSADEVSEVQEAAKQCDSIRFLNVDPCRLTTGETVIVAASVIRMFPRIRDFCIFEREGEIQQEEAQAVVVAPLIVDKLLYAMMDNNSNSQLIEFSTSASGGPDAIIKFAARFPLIKKFQLGFFNSRSDNKRRLLSFG